MWADGQERSVCHLLGTNQARKQFLEEVTLALLDLTRVAEDKNPENITRDDAEPGQLQEDCCLHPQVCASDPGARVPGAM